MLHKLKPVHWLKYTSNALGINEGFSVGQERSLRWQMWWSRHLPWRTYPVLPFEKVVVWHWHGRRLTLPRPWGKDPFAEFGEDD